MRFGLVCAGVVGEGLVGVEGSVGVGFVSMLSRVGWRVESDMVCWVVGVCGWGLRSDGDWVQGLEFVDEAWSTSFCGQKPCGLANWWGFDGEFGV